MLSANFKKPIQNFSENKYTKIAVGVITVLIPVCFLIAAIIGFFLDFHEWKYKVESFPILSSIQLLPKFAILIYATLRLYFEKEKIGEFKLLLKISWLLLLSLILIIVTNVLIFKFFTEFFIVIKGFS